VSDTLGYAILMAVGTGFVTAGLAGNLLHLIEGREPDLAMLTEEDLMTPVRIVGLVFAAPWMLFHAAGWWFIAKPPVGIQFLLAALGWSFLQGVFILTQVFGVT
jgi:hypothetical protein